MAPTQLTKREDQIRRLVVDGLTNEAIASELGISARTVEAHLRMLFRKMGASRRDELSAPRPARTPPPAARAEPTDDSYIDHLKQQLADRDHQVRSYEAAVRRLVDRQFPLFDERVEITVTVGDRPGDDVVVERHWTDPNPYLVYRVIRPITAHGPANDVVANMTCEVVGADVGVAVEVVADRQNRPLALILFQPGLEKPAEWELRYRTPGLWNPLRERGEDTLSWAAGTLDGRHADGIQEVRAHFLFPSDAVAPEVVEGRGMGVVERQTDRHLVYVDRAGTGGLYDWRLRMRRREG